jgi:hypothetical protein
MMLKVMLKLSCNRCAVKYLMSDTLLYSLHPACWMWYQGKPDTTCHLVEAKTELSLLLGSDWLHQ